MVAKKWVQPSQIWWNVVLDVWMFGTMELKQFLSRFVSQRVPGWRRGTKIKDFPKPRFQLVTVFRCVSFIAPKNNDRNLQKQAKLLWFESEMIWINKKFGSCPFSRRIGQFGQVFQFGGPPPPMGFCQQRQRVWVSLIWNIGIEVYCWWLKSCTTWDVWNPIDNGKN